MSPIRPASTPPTSPRPLLRRLSPLFWALALAPWITAEAGARPPLADRSRLAQRPGDPDMPAHQASMLIEYYQRFLKDQDLEGFRRDVDARYNEGTLCRIVQNGDVQARRSAVLALGIGGSIGSNAVVAKGLKDADPTVRSLAANALWAIWGRADTPENNAALDEVQALIARGRLDEAIKKSNALIARASGFAEAINQRAIAHYLGGHLAESAGDCRRVLELNPYHFGALSGLGQCQIRLGQKDQAIRTFRRALDLQPYSADLRETIAALEAAGD